MQSKLRKVLSVLAVLAMLCTLLPLGVMSVSAAEETNLLVNGDFEAGNVGELPTGWSAQNTSKQYAMTTTAQTHDGSYAAALGYRYTNFVLYQDVEVQANTRYTVTFWYKSTNTSSSTGAGAYLFGVYGIGSLGNTNSDPAGTLIDSTATEAELDYHNSDWTQVTYTFNSGSNTSVRVAFSPKANKTNFDANSGSEFMYVDGVSMTAGGTANPPIVSWDFEDGNVGFTSGGPGQSIVVDPDDSTNHVLYWQNAAKWGVIYKVVTLEKNTDYVFDFKMKTSQAGSAYITVEVSSWGTYDQVSFNTKTTWTQHSIEFNTGDKFDKVMLKIQNGGTVQDFWVDDFTVIKKEAVAPEEPEGGVTTETPVLDLDWEDGVAKFKYGSVVAEGPDGSNCFKWSSGGNYDSTYLTVGGVDQNAEYVITFKAKANASTSMFITIQSGNWANYYYNESFKPTTEWAEYTITTNVKDYPTGGSILFKFQDGGTATDLWIDDLTVAKLIVPEEEESDNLVVNGDFEAGTLTGWEKHQSTVISTNAHGGSYAANLKGNGGWGGMLNQTVSVVPNAKYTVSLWLKTNANGVNVQIFDGNSSGALLANKWFTATDWTQLTWDVTPTNNAIFINFCGGGNGISEDVLVDDITIIGEKIASDDGFIKNGDLEMGTSDHWNVHGNTTVSKAAANSGKYGLELVGDGGWGGLADQNFATEIGHTYAVTFSIKAVANGVNVQVQNPVGTTVKSKWITDTSWTTYTLEFTAVDATTRINVCGGGNDLATTVYMDDFKVVEVKDPNFDGYIWNGDFEAGSLTKWEFHQQTALSTEAAKNGKYGAKLIGNGGWGGCLTQSNIAVEVGKTYKLSFWYKTPKNGLNMQLKNQDDQSTSIVSKYLSGKSDWTLYEATFESGYATTLVLNFSGSGKNTTDELWIDDIKLENLSGDEMDRCEILKNSGTSIRDVDDNNRGLAFRFFTAVEGAQWINGNQYVPGTGTMKLFNYDEAIGTLMETGAIVTNQESIGTGDMTMDDVNGTNVIKIPAKYLTDGSETEIGFAVRIVNIPDEGVNTTIYARPYYTYEINGEQVTVYGDTTGESYEAVASVRRSLKVLAIGNSFSVDAMRNYLYDVLKSADYDQVILGNLYVGGCSLDQHWSYINGKQGAYEFHKNDDDGKWVKTEGYQALDALQEETWDIITVQQVSSYSGMPDTFGNLQNLVNWVNQYKTNPNAKVLWHMTWAYQQDSTHEAFPNYNSDQMTMYNAIVDTVQNTVLNIDGIDGVIPAGTAIQNLRQTLGDTLTADGYHLNDLHGDYTAALTWYAAITGETLDLVDYAPAAVTSDVFNIKRAVGRAIINPYAVSDMGETVLIAGSDFQASTWDKNMDNINGILNGIKNTDGYELFDGLLFGGDYTPDHGHDAATEGIGVLDEFSDGFVSGNKVYVEGNHDAPTVEMLSPYGNNDPVGGTYGVYVIHEEDYGQFGAGDGEKLYNDLKAYFDEKIESGWDTKKPIFVLTHVPLHFNWRTVSDYGAGKNAQYVVEALNEAGEAGFNVIFMYGHNHSGDYDAYVGGASVYLAKGDEMLIAKPENYKEYQSVELKFTYLNYGYVGYFPNFGNGTDYTLSMTTFRIRDDGAVIITRYSADGYTNLKAQGVMHSANEYVTSIPVNETVYGPQRIVTATSDEEYTGD